MRIAVILARQESKRLPDKNKKLLAGKTLVEHSIDQAFECGLFDYIVVSTDDQEIKYIIWTRYKNRVIIVNRPFFLAVDSANSEEPVLHAIDEVYRSTEKMPEWVCLLQPTSPLRIEKDIRDSIIMAERAGKSIHSRCNNRVNGAIYYMKVKDLYQKRKFDCESYVYDMPEERSVDIDTIEDFRRAEKIIKRRQNEFSKHSR
jgi:CMP-N-acetylneuraminic acid synthetase